MPYMQTMFETANQRFSYGNLSGPVHPHKPQQGQFAPGQSLADELEALAIPQDAASKARINALPGSIRAAIQAVLHENLGRHNPLGVTFAWLPGHHTEVTICEAAGVLGPGGGSRGGITILVRTPIQ